MKRILLFCLLMNSFLFAQGGQAPALQSWKIIEVLPHRTGAFTQGFFWDGAHYWESTGGKGASRLSKLDAYGVTEIAGVDLPKEYFGEGAVVSQGYVFVLTWKARKVLIYRAEDLKYMGDGVIPGEGWGLTSDPQGKLWMSDGSGELSIITAENFMNPQKLRVWRGDGQAVVNLNELEWINGKIWANVWRTNDIYIIDPVTGKVERTLDLSVLVADASSRAQGKLDVLNGISLDAEAGVVRLTGKLWPVQYRIRLQ